MRPQLSQTIWRWHFYAGLLVAPFMLILAVTGAIYLFNTLYADWSGYGATQVYLGAPRSFDLTLTRSF